jgi:UTP--glucose-1-phosphate uridylyltransferase
VGDAPVLVMLGDHVYISGEEHRCARQLMDVFEQRHAPVSGVIRKEERDLRLFGTVAGQRIDNTSPVTYEVNRIVEKPDIAYAREHLRVNGLSSSTYLCFFGMHVMTPDIFDCLAMLKTRNLRDHDEIQLTRAQAMLMAQRAYYACEINGEHYDIGVPEGFARTIRAFAGGG